MNKSKVPKMGYYNYVCECGCGEIVPYGKRFMLGHNTKLRNPENNPAKRPEVKKKIAESKMGDKNPMKRPEVAKKNGDSQRKNKRFGENHHNYIPLETRFCGCNCGGTFVCKINSKQRYINGHNARVKHPTEDPNVREKISRNSKGVPKYSLRGENNPAKRLETREKLSKSHIGKKKSEKHKSNLRKAAIKQWQNPEQIKLRNIITTKQWQDPEYVSKQMISRHVSPNKTEKLLDRFLQEFFPNQFKFVGDGKDKNYIIGGKSPDFIHIEKSLIIELFGDFHHGESCTGIPNEQHEKERIDHFAKFGYKTLIIWEHELQKGKNLFERIKNFYLEE